MNKCKITLWGREFELGIEYDCYSGEEVTPEQENVLTKFIETVNDDDLKYLKSMIIDYILENNLKNIESDHIDNIFKYVIPKYLYIIRNEGKRVVALMCNYKFDMENGIAIIFEDEKAVNIGKQDIIL